MGRLIFAGPLNILPRLLKESALPQQSEYPFSSETAAGFNTTAHQRVAWSLQEREAQDLQRARSAKDSFVQLETRIFLTLHSVFVV